MATNKHAQIRYTVLDECFSNFNRAYTYKDLLKEVNDKLYYIDTDGIKLRQLQYDIAYMKSDVGYGIELNEELKLYKGGSGPGQRIFRYKDPNFSLANHPLNVNDSKQLETTLTILSRYKHREEFSWLDELIPRMQLAFDLVASGDNSMISYQQNIYLKGKKFIGELFNQIIKKNVIQITYEPFGKDSKVWRVHPYHLKQYNERWFLICYNEEVKDMSNYALDRIQGIEETSTSFEESPINWIDYFDDIIGVTKNKEANLEIVKLKFSEKRINYVLTKPLHGSQKIDPLDKSKLTIQIEVIPNNELIQLILSFGEDVEVLSPAIIREDVKEKIKLMNGKY